MCVQHGSLSVTVPFGCFCIALDSIRWSEVSLAQLSCMPSDGIMMMELHDAECHVLWKTPSCRMMQLLGVGSCLLLVFQCSEVFVARQRLAAPALDLVISSMSLLNGNHALSLPKGSDAK